MNAKNRIVFPLDFPSWNQASRYVRILSDAVGLFKVGLELFVAEGPQVLERIRQSTEAGIFLDLKLHDIPETVKRALAVVSSYTVDFVTIHCDAGSRLAEAVSVATQAGTRVLAVTVLTSMGKDDLTLSELAPEYAGDVSGLVLKRAAVAREAGCSGVVASGKEVSAIKESLGGDFIVVTPGIRPAGSVVAHDDQRRTVTPGEAVRAGADYIVIGRPIRDAEDPAAAARAIAMEIDSIL